MIIGISPTDIYTILALARGAYNRWRGVCGDYADLTDYLRSLTAHLSQAAAELTNESSLFIRSAEETEYWENVLDECEDIIIELYQLVDRWRDVRSPNAKRRNWHKLCMVMSGKKIETVRRRIKRCNSDMSTFASLVAVSALGRIEQSLGLLPHIHGLAKEMAEGIRDFSQYPSTAMTLYTDDEAPFWRQVRHDFRQRQQPITGQMMHRYSFEVAHYVDRLNESDPDRGQKRTVQHYDPTGNSDRTFRPGLLTDRGEPSPLHCIRTSTTRDVDRTPVPDPVRRPYAQQCPRPVSRNAHTSLDINVFPKESPFETSPFRHVNEEDKCETAYKFGPYSQHIDAISPESEVASGNCAQDEPRPLAIMPADHGDSLNEEQRLIIPPSKGTSTSHQLHSCYLVLTIL